MKKITLIGTRHYHVKNVPRDIQKALEFAISKLHPQIVLEEWSGSQPEESAASEVSRRKGIRWENIGTPSTGQFATYRFQDALDYPEGVTLPQYGPIDAQQKRELMMCKNIKRFMFSVDVGLVVIGVTHLHSMFLKLSNEFEVAGYAFGHEAF
jgi:hypothetical protein